MNKRLDARQAIMGFTEETFPVGTHMCLIYDNDKEREHVIAKFLQAGLAQEEKVAYFADIMTPADVRTWLAEMGVQVPEAESEGFSATIAMDTYCPDGKFIPQRMLDTLRAFYHQTLDEDYPGGRVSGEMTWALRGIPGAERLMEYEALVNDVLTTHPITAICQYDARRFDGAQILDVLRVHPMMIVHGQIVRNPYYMRPEDFLKEYSFER
ncbi:MAG: MEDS domain-containing protein [Myxococcota bacterium]|nr:MEDS domain-containing protein [Myxococcota bacterium]